jgi:hypothetical protein
VDLADFREVDRGKADLRAGDSNKADLQAVDKADFRAADRSKADLQVADRNRVDLQGIVTKDDKAKKPTHIHKGNSRRSLASGTGGGVSPNAAATQNLYTARNPDHSFVVLQRITSKEKA